MINYTELGFRFIAGGGLIVFITLLAKKKYPMLSGIFMLFPAVTLVGYYFIGQSMNVSELQHVTKFSIFALSTTFVFLVSLYYLQAICSLNVALVLSTLMWCAAAIVLIIISR